MVIEQGKEAGRVDIWAFSKETNNWWRYSVGHLGLQEAKASAERLPQVGSKPYQLRDWNNDMVFEYSDGTWPKGHVSE